MDLAKIGAYIASKRKALGMTQVQLANKLGMSDKSVSKWERGICLPDVSVYVDLCNVLGITLNEFLAGEDLLKEDVIKRSEENIINISQTEKKKYTKLQRLFFIMSAIYFICVCIMVFWKVMPGLNYVRPAGEYSQEMIISETIYDENDVMVFNYGTDDNHERIDLILTEYNNGKLANKTVLGSSYTANNKKGAVVIAPKFDHYSMTALLASKDDNNLPTEIALLSDTNNKNEYRRYVVRINENKHLAKGKEVPLAYVEYYKDKVNHLPIESMGNDQIDSGEGYIYVISLKVDWA